MSKPPEISDKDRSFHLTTQIAKALARVVKAIDQPAIDRGEALSALGEVKRHSDDLEKLLASLREKGRPQA